MISIDYNSNNHSRWLQRCWSVVCLCAFSLVGLAGAPAQTPTHATPTDTNSPTLALNGKIAFTSDRDGNREIYVMNNDGTGQVRLTHNPGVDDYPAWAPDGTQLAFLSGNALKLMNADGTNQAQLTTVAIAPACANNFGLSCGLSWSPNGTKIAFTDATGIFTINVDGSNRINLTNRPTDSQPSWSPDGARLVFARNTGSPSITYLIYTINTDGTNLTRWNGSGSSGNLGDLDPAWSPDGTRIAAILNRFAIDSSDLCIMNADGTRYTIDFVIERDHASPAWSPDGAKLAFGGVVAPYVQYTNSEIYVINADGSGITRLTNTPGYESHPAWQPLLTTQSSGIAFSAANFQAAETSGNATITVTRTGDTTAPASVDFTTMDDPATVRCDDTVSNHGAAYARCDYATTLDTLTFVAGETQRMISIPLIDDAHVEGNETVQLALRNPSGAPLGALSTATLTLLDNDTATSPNPILSTPFFVRQQYLDFLSREPEQGEPWSGVLNRCADVNNVEPNNASAGCDRLTVSAAFFGSPEFRLKGYFVYLFYKVALGRRPTYAEIIPDMRAVTGASAQVVFQKQNAFTDSFAGRAEFSNLYAALTNAAYVDSLLNHYGLSLITTPEPAPPDGTTMITLTRSDLVNRLNAQTLTRAQVLRAVVQSREVDAVEFNGAFVAMQYIGYLRRTPEDGGYNAWLNYLTAQPTDFRTMVNGFMNSTEYRLRFGQP